MELVRKDYMNMIIHKRDFWRCWLIVVLTAGVLTGGTHGAEVKGEPKGFSYVAFGKVLKKYVDEKGMVNYKGLKEHRQELDRFLSDLSKLDRQEYSKWKRSEQIAFWINAYNGLTLKAIIDHYPIKSGFLKSFRYPKNSIRQISGVWDKLRFSVMGKKMTLNEIEHEVLRGEFKEPRIHVALVCAAMGCPSLRNEPYEPKKLNEQFADQTRKFIAKTSKFRIDRGKKVVYLSSIFKWFGDDFVKTYTPKEGYSKKNKTERAVLHFTGQHLPTNDSSYLKGQKYKLKYLDYDWSLNEQKPKKK